MPPEPWKFPPWVALGTFKNIQKATLLRSRHCDPTRKIQEWCSLTMGHHTRRYLLALVHWATKKQNAVNSILSLHSGSSVVIRPGNSSYSMWAWLHSTISVHAATWHWEAGIRWLHYCKWAAPVTYTNTRTHVRACANTPFPYVFQSKGISGICPPIVEMLQ